MLHPPPPPCVPTQTKYPCPATLGERPALQPCGSPGAWAHLGLGASGSGAVQVGAQALQPCASGPASHLPKGTGSGIRASLFPRPAVPLHSGHTSIRPAEPLCPPAPAADNGKPCPGTIRGTHNRAPTNKAKKEARGEAAVAVNAQLNAAAAAAGGGGGGGEGGEGGGVGGGGGGRGAGGPPPPPPPPPRRSGAWGCARAVPDVSLAPWYWRRVLAGMWVMWVMWVGPRAVRRPVFAHQACVRVHRSHRSRGGRDAGPATQGAPGSSSGGCGGGGSGGSGGRRAKGVGAGGAGG